MDRLPKKDSKATLDQPPLSEKERIAQAFAPFPNKTNPTTGEVSGPTGPEPTRYGDWERKGRCSDFWNWPIYSFIIISSSSSLSSFVITCKSHTHIYCRLFQRHFSLWSCLNETKSGHRIQVFEPTIHNQHPYSPHFQFIFHSFVELFFGCHQKWQKATFIHFWLNCMFFRTLKKHAHVA